MIKKYITLLACLMCAASLGACVQVADNVDPSTDTIPLTDTDENQSPTDPNNADKDNKELNILDFIELDRNRSDESGKPYLTKNDILNFDNTAYYHGPSPKYSHDGGKFHFYIVNRDRTLFGYEGFLEYYAICDPETVEATATPTPDGMYDTWYEYTGTGDEVAFGENLSFAIPNVTYNGFLDIVNKLCSFSEKNIEDIKFVSDAKAVKLDVLREVLAIDNPDAAVNNESLFVSVYNLPVPGHPNWSVTIQWINEKRHLSPMYETDPLEPWDTPAVNRLTVHLQYNPNNK